MKYMSLCGMWLCLAACATSAPLSIPDAGFESQTPELTAGQSTLTLTPWLESGGPGAAAGFKEFAAGFSAEGTDHLGMLAGHDVWQNLSDSFLANTLYTLTVGVGHRSGPTTPANESTAVLSTSTGIIYANGVTPAATAAAAGTFADGTVVTLDTIEDPSAVGKSIRLLLRARGTGPSYFDNIRLDAAASTPNGRPTGFSSAPANITADGATIGGSVSSIGSAAPAVTLYYGTTDGGNDAAAWSSTLAIPGTPTATFTTTLTGLAGSTRYYTRLRFSNASGSTWAAVTRNVDTLLAPVVANLPATNITPSSATAGARLTAYSGTPPAITVYFGTVDGGTTAANWSRSVSLGQVTGSASGNLSGLLPGTLYYYRPLAVNPAGSAWAPATLSFTTGLVSPASVVNRPARSISLNAAVLQAEVSTTGGAAPAVTFYYGPVDGGTVPGAWEGTVSAGVAAGKVSAPIGSLTAHTLYYFRSAATNSAGTTWAPASTSFTTAVVTLPVLRTLAATHLRSTMATVSGEVTSTGNETPSVMLYWGLTDGGTVAAAWEHAAAPGPASGRFSRVLTGLLPGTVYSFRACATNSAGSSWAANTELFATALTEAPPEVVINEVHFDPLDPSRPQEFIELHNPGTTAVDLTGWRLASAVDYTFGPVTLPAGGYFCVVQNPARFATTWPAAAANSAGPWLGKLANRGETIELRHASGQLVNAVDYAEGFPWPTASRGAGPSMELLHPTLDPGLGASWRRATATATPGAVNGARLATASAAPPAIRGVGHFPGQPPANTDVAITATVTDPDGISGVSLRYQIVAPGSYIRKTDATYLNAANWIPLTMLDDGTAGDAVAGDSIFTAVIPASVQVHRRLIRYQITVTDALANSVKVPYADDEQPNFAYFVYEALPAWSGALRPTVFGGFPVTPVKDYPVSLLQSIEPWHLIANEADIISCQYTSGSPFRGTLVHRGTVYDHITYQVRGIGSTYVSGKNKWGLKFNRARDFQAYDNWGRPYSQTWNSLGLNACASPWASLHRGSAGIEEALSFRLYELGGVPSLRTNYVHWRVIRRAAEVNSAASTITGDPLGNGASIKGQFSGDLWGLYLALEPTEGNFLDERGLEDGNLYSIEGDGGDKKHQADTQPTGTADWDAFRNATAQTNQTEAWYRANNDLTALYTFLAFSRLVGNVDVRPGDNYRYYHRPGDNRWVVMPYDLDMMFIPAFHWGGSMDGKVVAAAPHSIRTISRHPALALEYRNRCRELLSLMATDPTPNGGQIGQLVQEYARLVNPPDTALTWADLDAAMWNLHPRSTGSGSNTGYANHKGNFFRATYLDGTRGGLGGTLQTGSWLRHLPDPDNDKFSDHEGLSQWMVDFSTNSYPGNAAAWVRKASSAGGSGTDNSVDRQKGYGYKSLEWEALYGGFVDCVNTPAPATADTAYPYTPVIFAHGAAGFPANDLRFTSSDFADPQGSATGAAVQWRLGEISAPGIPGYDASRPSVYELENVWTSAEIPLTSPSVAEVRIPAGAVETGHTYRARVRHKDATGRWSYWSAPVQFIASSADTAGYQDALRITGISYDPAPATAAERAHPSWNALWTSQQFEYVELANISSTAIGLTDVRFTKGIDYDFPAGTVLAAGARLIAAKNPIALAIRYGDGLPLAPGSFDPDSLANGGEQLKLSYGSGITIFDFTYGTSEPWPTGPNGTGPSLVLVSPEKPGLNHGDPMEWRSSRSAPGRPGSDDRTSYAQWAANSSNPGAPEDDPDADGLTNLMEFSLNAPPTVPSHSALPRASLAGGSFRLTFTYAPWHGGHTRHVEFSDALGTWNGTGTLIGRSTHPDGSFTDTWQSPLPLTPESPRQFARLRVSVP